MYPKEDSLEPDAYIAYNFRENAWTSGTGFFTTYEDSNVFPNVITTGSIEKVGHPSFGTTSLKMSLTVMV